MNNYGLEFNKSNNYSDAIHYFSKAININPIYVNAYSKRGNVFDKMGETFLENALIDFNMALLLDPNHENTLFNRAMLFMKNAEFQKAIIDFSRLVEINPNDFEAFSKRETCYAIINKIQASIK